MKVTDLIETDSNDAPVHRMSLSYDPAKGYASRHDARTPALLFPVFQRERTDKTVDLGSVGMEQLNSRLVSATDPTEAPPELPNSEILVRRVWTKGTTAVRKVALISTHKEPRHGYAPFVIFGTDYSGKGRADEEHAEDDLDEGEGRGAGGRVDRGDVKWDGGRSHTIVAAAPLRRQQEESRASVADAEGPRVKTPLLSPEAPRQEGG